jgi:hypothetical protein
MRSLRLVACIFVLMTALPTRASTDYTDIWWSASGGEQGWGVNFAHQQSSIFATFYIFGASGAPVWYTALLTRSFGETFTGPVYASTGTWFGAPWITPPPATAVGNATFIATTPYRGTLSYTIDSVPVSKTIERYGFLRVSVDGTYLGAYGGTYTGSCAANTPATFLSTLQFVVSQSGNPGTVTIDFVQSAPPYDTICRMQGPGTQFGRTIAIPNAEYICSGFPTIPVNVTSLRPLDDGVEIHWEANDAGCIEKGRAAAITQ